MRDGMRVDKTKWENALIKDSIKTLKVKDAVQKKDYLLTGKYPIISQEKDFISGYCNTEDNLNEVLEEVIIFGDHTRIVKYVDFDFCVGADGVKVLRPNNKLSTKYLYYFIKWSNIPNNGYSRHFKFLKEVEIKYPKDKSIQQAIASELDAIQTMIDGYKAQLADLDALAQSIFLDMFGDPVTNPKGWKVSTLENIVAKDCPITYGIVQPGDEVEDGVPVVRPVDLTGTYIKRLMLKKVSQDISNSYRRTILKGDEILICVRGTTGIVSFATEELKGCNVTRGIVPLSFDKQNQWFMFWCIKSTGMNGLIQKLTRGATLKQINIKDLRQLPIPVPPIELQKKFGMQAKLIETQKALLKGQLIDAETLMAERMQYYFS